MAKAPFKNSIENVYNRMIIYSLITAIASILVGLVLVFLPSVSNKVVGIIVGVVFLAIIPTTLLDTDGKKTNTNQNLIK